MPHSYYRASMLVAAVLLATSACSGSRMVPAGGNAGSSAFQMPGSFMNAKKPGVDTTSILKKLTKQSVIGSTIDPSNGDKGPRGLAVAPINYGLKKGTLVVCNFNNKANAAGNGTTVETLAPKAGSKPIRFAQNKTLKGCSGVALAMDDNVWTAGLTAHKVTGFTNKGKVQKTIGAPLFKAPFGAVDATTGKMYAPEDIFVSDVQTGSIISIGVGSYGAGKPTQVATGFAVNQQKPAGKLGPTGLLYTKGKTDVLYIVDGANNTIVAFHNASELLETNEITVQPGGKTFTCKAKAVCAGKSAPYVVHSGSPLNAPVAAALLPNGNLVVANTKGSNMLVEMTPTGKVLATKVVDKGAAGAIFGLVATGTKDANTALYFSDTHANNVQALQQ